MRKLVIILPVLFSVSICTGLAMGLTNPEAGGSELTSVLLEAPAQSGSMAILIPFSCTADDGGALGEKAKVLAMRRQLDSENPEIS